MSASLASQVAATAVTKSAWQRMQDSVREFVRRNWPTVKRAELAERRQARQAQSRQVLSKRVEKSLSERREQLVDDAAQVPCPPIVLARAQLLELETSRSPMENRPGRRPTPVLVEESLKVWKLHHEDGFSYRTIDLSFGIPKDRVQRIIEYLDSGPPS